MSEKKSKRDTAYKKADYEKPQVHRVKLTITNPILGLCSSAAPADEAYNCEYSGAPCAPP
ncbi:MAG: hypothetical protein WBW48_00665 [Anaerolineae bacterium]